MLCLPTAAVAMLLLEAAACWAAGNDNTLLWTLQRLRNMVPAPAKLSTFCRHGGEYLNIGTYGPIMCSVDESAHTIWPNLTQR